VTPFFFGTGKHRLFGICDSASGPRVPMVAQSFCVIPGEPNTFMLTGLYANLPEGYLWLGSTHCGLTILEPVIQPAR
jgi:hypothetical protein